MWVGSPAQRYQLLSLHQFRYSSSLLLPVQSAHCFNIQLRRWNLSLPMEVAISKTSPPVSPPSSRHTLADAKMPFLVNNNNPVEQKYSSSTVREWLTQNTSTGLSQLAPNQQKERKRKDAQVECHLCGKFLSTKRGLTCHIRAVHSIKPSMTNTSTENSLNSSQKFPKSDQQVNNNDSDIGSSKPEMEEPNNLQNLDKDFSKRERTSKDMAAESTLTRGNEKCVIIFVFGGKKLKLTTMVREAFL